MQLPRNLVFPELQPEFLIAVGLGTNTILDFDSPGKVRRCSWDRVTAETVVMFPGAV